MRNRLKNIKDKIENKISGTFAEPLPLRKQLTRMITVCCITAVCVQVVVMVALTMKQYVSTEREDVLYILESDNARVDNILQYVEEMVLAIQHNVGLRSFFRGNVYSEEIVTEQLKSVANLFSERNRLEVFEPFVEKIYLYNETDKSIYNLYYPMTLAEIRQSQNKSNELYEKYKKSGKAFYFETEGEHLNLCMKLYDSQMDTLGTCIFVLNKVGIEENFSNLEKMKYYNWAIFQGEEVLLGKKNMMNNRSTFSLEHDMPTGFGLRLYAGVSEWIIFQSLWTTLGIIVLISMVLMVLLSFLGRKMAIYYVHPLETIAEKIKLVGKGNFDTKLDEYRLEELQNISNTFNEMTDYIERLVKEVYETQLIAQQAQIQYLQAQMDPHFLFNVLSMIEVKAAMNQDKEVQEMLYKLSNIYQGKIFRKNEHFILLEDEMEIVDFYLSLQNSRFGDKISYKISYEGGKEEYQGIRVPRLSIEPIVENAVCHGLEPKEGKGRIQIGISKKENFLEVCIEDDGVGFNSEQIVEKNEDKNHSHVGLWNTNKMIHNLCGKEYGLVIESEIGKGTKVNILLPIRNEEELYVESNDC